MPPAYRPARSHPSAGITTAGTTSCACNKVPRNSSLLEPLFCMATWFSSTGKTDTSYRQPCSSCSAAPRSASIDPHRVQLFSTLRPLLCKRSEIPICSTSVFCLTRLPLKRTNKVSSAVMLIVASSPATSRPSRSAQISSKCVCTRCIKSVGFMTAPRTLPRRETGRVGTSALRGSPDSALPCRKRPCRKSTLHCPRRRGASRSPP